MIPGQRVTAGSIAAIAALFVFAAPGTAQDTGTRVVCLAPETGGKALAATLGESGSFHFHGLKPGNYRLSLHTSSASRQTQNSSFGERACTQAAADDTAASTTNARPGLRNRISMNVTIGRRVMAADVDGDAITVAVGADGMLMGSAQAAAPPRP